MENDLKNISTIYNHAPLRPVKFTHLIVDSKLITLINRQYNILRNQLGSNMEHSNLELLDYNIRSMIYKYSSSILPLKEIIKEDDINELLLMLTEEVTPYLNDTENLMLFIHTVNQLYLLEEHEYFNALKSIIRYGTQTYTIVSKYKLTDVEREISNDIFKNFNVEILAFNEFNKKYSLHDVVIFIGSPNIYPPSISSYINANIFYFLYFDIYHKNLNLHPIFSHNRLLQNKLLPIISEINFENKVSNIEIIEEMKYEDLDEKLFEEPSLPKLFFDNYVNSVMEPNEKKVRCRLIELESGQFIFEEVGPNAKCDIIDSKNFYERVHLNEIEPDNCLVIIQFKNWHDRKNFADSYFRNEDIKIDRKNVNLIKHHLLKMIEKNGLERYTAHLNRTLDLKLKPYQISGLTKEESFYLRNKQDFYKLINHFTKNKELTDKLFNSSFRLANFHQKIGYVARKELRNFLESHQSELKDLKKNNLLYIPHMEYLKIELFRIKSISNDTYEVPISKVGNIIKFNYEEVT